ncbi:MAG: hypothetical protein HOP13_07675 [Alphaproteobacteria bacterium]|nr:hypothetical protein [Alphaproteobacteria bacterium]
MAIFRTLLLLPAFAFVGGIALLAWNGSASASYAPPANPPQTIVIGIDLSSSNPLIRDDGFAGRVAARIAPMITNLPPRSRVLLRSFGAYNAAANNKLSLDIVIAPKTARAEDIARLVGGVIGGLPKMVRDGRVQVQNSTNIVPFLMNISRSVDCRAMPVHVILASDGVEDSQVARLSRRTATLPAPLSAPFPGCEELMILGIGRGLNSPGDTERLFGEWQFWSQSAGFRRFVGLNDW